MSIHLFIQACLQGLLEWLPVSSSGFIVLISMLLGSQFLEAIDIALALHLGSGLA
ncbi:MAG TPA: UDP-diphosphatase, partial [Ignisphaera aggregans]|nr:UDP-diphosphatase [Ignisphaera aggregans]